MKNSWEHNMGGSSVLLPFLAIQENPSSFLVRESLSGCVDYYPICHSLLRRITETKFSGNHKNTKSRGITSSANGKHRWTWAGPPVSGSLLTSGLCLFFSLEFLLTPSACEQGRTHRHMGEKIQIRECSWVVICSFTVLCG